MLFNSFYFYIFFAIVFLTYWLLPAKYQPLLLLAASYLFYVSAQPAYALLLLASTLVSYTTARLMEHFPQKKKFVLTGAVLIHLGVLGVFKYLHFFALTFNLQLPAMNLILPLGISFFTFQTIGYLIDVYRGKHKAETNLMTFALFMSFFPVVTAGPIERRTQLLPQLHTAKKLNYGQIVSGAQLFVFGLFKKVVIADNLALVVNHVFDFLPQYKGFSLILTMIFFSWQLYADFSGYTDMARGIGRMLGFELLENFRTPYLASSVQDFWRRWHISLSSWFRDYLYIPLGGSRVSTWRAYLNTGIVFLVCGLWHGASWNFVIWGAIHGFVLMGERFFSQLTKNRFKLPKIIGQLYTYSVVVTSWIVFRAPTLPDAWYVARQSLSGVRHFISPIYLWASVSQMFKTNLVEIAIAFGCLATIVCLDVLKDRVGLGKIIRTLPRYIRWVVYVLVVTSIVLLQNTHATTFIYVQF